MARDRGTLTYEAYAALPDDGKRYEIHGGELSVTPAPSSRHELVSGNLYDLLRRHVTAAGLGDQLDAPVDVILSGPHRPLQRPGARRRRRLAPGPLTWR